MRKPERSGDGRAGPGKLADEYARSRGRKVGEIVSDDPRTVSEDTPLDEIVRMMEKHQIKRVPVVRGGHVVGIVSRANLCTPSLVLIDGCGGDRDRPRIAIRLVSCARGPLFGGFATRIYARPARTYLKIAGRSRSAINIG